MNATRGFGMLVVLLALGFAATLGAFGLWLEAPSGRNNAHDPRSSSFLAFPTFPPSTATPVPPSGSPTLTHSATESATSTPTPTPMGTFTPTPTFSATPLTWYNGDSSPYRLQDLSPSIDTNTATGGQGGFSEISSGGGAQGNSTYLQITLSAGATTGYCRAVLGGAPLNASTANMLSLWIRVPGPSTGCSTSFLPEIQLRTGGAYPNDRSTPISATAYLVGTTVLGYDSWLQVEIPLAAFVGPNSSGGTFAAAALNSITAVVIAAGDDMYSNGALPLSMIDVDNIVFLSLTPAPPAPPQYAQGTMFDGFEFANTLWYPNPWVFASDTLSCTPTTQILFPPAGAAPIDMGGNSLTACHAGHMKGFQAQTASPCITTPPNPNGPWPLVRMMAYFGASDGPVDLSNNSLITGLKPAGASGMTIRMKVGSNSPGQVYSIQILRSATNGDWDNYSVQIADSSLSTSWQAISLPFPPDGQAAGGGLGNHSGSTTQLWWAQAGWGSPQAWARTDFLALIIRVMNGGNFDLWSDDIEFY